VIRDSKPGTLLAINNYFYRRGGAEAVFLDHIAMFEEIGWTVVPYAMRHENNMESEWSDYFVSEIEYGRDADRFRRIVQAANVIYSVEAQRNLRRLIDRIRPSVAHAHNVYHHLSPSIFSTLRASGIPTVMTVHDLKLACPAYKMLRDGKVCEDCRGGHVYNVLRHRCIKGSVSLSAVVLAETVLHRILRTYRDKIDRLVVPSRFYIDKLAEWGWSRDQMVHIPNFVNAEDFSPEWQEEGYFAFAGRLSEEKGIATLIRAAARSGQRLVVAGTGPQQAELQALAKETGARVEFAGYVSGEALHRLIGESLALVLPSEWYENAPISVLEAYALGRPVIGAGIGGIPELIRAGETGVLAASGNVEDLARALSHIAGLAPAERKAMGAAGRSWVQREFSPYAYRDRMLSLYGTISNRPFQIDTEAASHVNRP
tara:strand:- start:60423 stop:61709 length:1287 start_codon:yes stop_codon:yes gene_type:complete